MYTVHDLEEARANRHWEHRQQQYRKCAEPGTLLWREQCNLLAFIGRYPAIGLLLKFFDERIPAIPWDGLLRCRAHAEQAQC